MAVLFGTEIKKRLISRSIGWTLSLPAKPLKMTKGKSILIQSIRRKKRGFSVLERLKEVF